VSWKEGIAAAFMIAVTDFYLIPFGLFLGGSALEIGLLVAIPQLLGSVSQLTAVKIVKLLGSRQRFLPRACALQACLLIPMAALSFWPCIFQIEILIACTAIFRILGGLIGTVWGSLASDYLPANERGAYFGWRSQITGLAGVGGMLVGGLVLFFSKIFLPQLGFLCLFLLASLARFISAALMNQMEDIPLTHHKDSDFTFVKFLSRFKESNFVKFVLYVTSVTFAAHLAAPYFSVYMLRDLKMTYIGYMTIHLSAVLAGLFGFTIWGHHADQVGNARVLKMSSFLIPLIPFLWLFSANFWWLIVVELFAGFVWSGFNLCSVNFIFDAVAPEKRVRCLGYFNLINGIGVFAGALVGGYLAEHLPRVMGSRLFLLFLFSGILRYLSHFLLSEQFKEVRGTTRQVSSAELFFSVVGMKPIQGRNREVNGIDLFKSSH